MRPECLAVPCVYYLKLHTEPYRSDIDKLESDVRCYTRESFAPCEILYYVYGAAVYFLSLKQQVVYVGQTTRLTERVEEHMGIRKGKRRAGDGFVGNLEADFKTIGKSFDSTFFVPVNDQADRLHVEASLIHELAPGLNQVQPSLPIGVISHNANMIIRSIKEANRTSQEEPRQ